MDPRLCALCVTLALASFSRRSGAIGPVIRCEPCDAVARLLCKPLSKDCAERVREPGCGCCMTCALSFGQPCGVYTGRCGSGLICQQQPGETKPLQALLEGRGVCANATNKRPAVRATPPVNELPDVLRPQRPDTKVVEVPGPPLTVQENSFPQTKQEPESGPCRREIESILSSLKITHILNPRGFRIPNCDKKGYYKKKQCRPSKGRKRGFCWCVDKHGQPLPAFDGKERGDAQYYNSGSQ
ncbi:insulin-like growth factor-binding protein 3 isoform X3 [Betta splendens]|uniref:Insulin-like growth factor-binding protein 3 isoform X3 n=1 Tax=Betta splendens TaxID=158456 RepID=A0A6P7L2P1_BETSP|nr:insulin-like growth factor-binding protein 3 isoform X3 [Betta splendens]